MTPLIIAHRGWSARAPENTMAAFRHAMEFGADGLELDVHLSRDGHVVVCHDDRLERTTNGSGFIVEHDLDQLKSLDAGAWFSPEYAGERIPTLKELFEEIVSSTWRGLVNVELKYGFLPYPGLEQAVVDLVREFDLVDQVLVSSFKHSALVELKQIEGKIKTAPLYNSGIDDPVRYAQSIGSQALHPIHTEARPEIIKEARQAGITVNAWTIDDPDIARRLAEVGVDGIITNRPDEIRLALGAP